MSMASFSFSVACPRSLIKVGVHGEGVVHTLPPEVHRR